MKHFCSICEKELSKEEYKACIKGLEQAKRKGNIEHWDEEDVMCKRCIDDCNSELRYARRFI